MDINVHYYTDQWNDLTPRVKNFKIEDYGINRIPEATITLLGKASDLSGFLTNPRKIIRIRANPAAWQNLFYGMVDNPFHKALLGTPTDMRVVSLDLFHVMNRLARDTITFDYYRLQSALTPLTDENAWTYREMIEDFLQYPDSVLTGCQGTGYHFNAANDPNGIDHIIDTCSSWSENSLLEALRIACDRIGYDGYLDVPTEFEYYVKVFPYNKSPVATLSAPYIKEPKYEGGSAMDIGNIIFVWGGVDKGVPADGDRWTEYGYAKYNPKAWTVTPSSGTMTITDANNTNFGDYAVNNKCVKALFNAPAQNNSFYFDLDITKTAEANVDCLNRCTQLGFYFYLLLDANYKLKASIHLVDDDGHSIFYPIMKDENQGLLLQRHTVYQMSVPVGEEIYGNGFANVWIYNSPFTTFDWEHVRKFRLYIYRVLGDPLATMGVEIDGLMFTGGYSIEPFKWYSATLNPPKYDNSSIQSYEAGVYHHHDSNISSFEQAQSEGTRLLANLKNPIPKMTLTKVLPTTQIRPSNVVTVSGVDWRVYGVTYEWSTKTKEVHATYDLIGKTSPLPPLWTEENELRYLIK